MMNDRDDLTKEQEQQLLAGYRIMWELANSCGVPGVRTAARAALAELHAALDGQAIAIDFYSHQWAPGAARESRAA